MNPDTNKFENVTADFSNLKQQLAKLTEQQASGRLLRPDGTPVPEHWSVFHVGEIVTVKHYCFKVAYINETTLVLEPTGPSVVGTAEKEEQDGKDL